MYEHTLFSVVKLPDFGVLFYKYDIHLDIQVSPPLPPPGIYTCVSKSIDKNIAMTTVITTIFSVSDINELRCKMIQKLTF